MRFISAWEHPKYGHCVLFGNEYMEYCLDHLNETIGKYMGWTLDEVKERLISEGFTEVI